MLALGPPCRLKNRTGCPVHLPPFFNVMVQDEPKPMAHVGVGNMGGELPQEPGDIDCAPDADKVSVSMGGERSQQPGSIP